MGIDFDRFEADVRRLWRRDALELTAAVARIEGRAQDGGGALVEARSKPLDMQAGISRTAPGNWDYTVAGAVVSMAASFFMRGGVPVDVAADDVTITGNGQWVVLECTPGATPGSDTTAYNLWTAAGKPQDHDGLLVRGLHQFNLVGGVAVEIFDARWGGEVAMEGY